MATKIQDFQISANICSPTNHEIISAKISELIGNVSAQMHKFIANNQLAEGNSFKLVSTSIAHGSVTLFSDGEAYSVATVIGTVTYNDRTILIHREGSDADKTKAEELAKERMYDALVEKNVLFIPEQLSIFSTEKLSNGQYRATCHFSYFPEEAGD